MRRRSAAIALGAALVAFAPASHAEPSIWYRASHPNARAEARLLRAMERMLDAEELAVTDPELVGHFARAAVAMLDLARPPSPEDPRLACAMARALVGSRLGRGPEAETLLQGAIPKLPDGTLLVTALLDLGRARTLAGNHAGARDAAARAVGLAVDAGERALAHYERARAELRTGEVAQAALDFQRAVAGAPSELVRLRARYGLGLALERSGDWPAALAALELAVAARLPSPPYESGDPLAWPGVFEPPYELDYVRALEALTRARRASERDERRAALETAVRRADAYLAAAPPSEPWLANARVFRARATADLHGLHAWKPPAR